MKKEKKSFKSYYEWRTLIEDGTVDFYFKTYLKELGLKIAKGATPIKLVDVYVSGSWKRGIEAYSIEDTVEIKKRKVNCIKCTPENLYKSLYLINKSAKVSRDTKIENYQKRKFTTVTGAKTRETNLYKLKDSALQKMIKENLVELKGYHKQKTQNGEIMLLLYKSGEYSFHKPVFNREEEKKYIKEISELGEIGIISAEKRKIEGINFFEAKDLLERYVKDEN